MTGDWLLEIRELSLDRGGRRVLERVGLSLRAGEGLTLIGPNGAGKTSLLLAMLGLLPAAGGSIQLNGRAVRDIPARARGRWASYVPQSLDGMPGYTVRDVVAGGRFPHVAPLAPLSRDDEEAIQAALDAAGLARLADRPIDHVSGGERQKALLAAAIAQDAQLMMLDEPNTALDPAYQVELVRVLRRWHAVGRGLVIVSHDLHLPAALETRVVALRGGAVVADGSARDVLNAGRLSEIFSAPFEELVGPDGRTVAVPRFG
ncbi:MAG: putative siderophore transport system ATP-binding protein YusV [Phycisphaerae bacterium]|nr:putative siderophore transport system ATP-binding protein YusV [Phycisphaerae bacterium]